MNESLVQIREFDLTTMFISKDSECPVEAFVLSKSGTSVQAYENSGITIEQ